MRKILIPIILLVLTIFIIPAHAQVVQGDLNGDTKIDVQDLGIFLYNWNSTSRPTSDFNQNGIVDVVDIGILLGNWGQASQTAGNAYYASPTGGGNGNSQSSPFRVADFWDNAQAGDTLYLLNGTYNNADSMINPPQNLSGVSGKPITVKALNDGQATIDGGGVKIPVILSYNDWFIVEGINAHSSSAGVVTVSRSNNCIVRRVVAWDAKADANMHVFSSNYGSDNLFEDCAGWGTGRKIFALFKDTNTTWRRNFFRWSGNNTTAWKVGLTSTYWSEGITRIENCIGTWDELPGTDPNQTYSIFGLDHSDECWLDEIQLLGNIAYDLSAQSSHVDNLYSTVNLSCPNKLRNNVAYTEKGSTTFVLDNSGPTNAVNLTSIGSDISGDATVNASLENPSLTSLGGNIIQYGLSQSQRPQAGGQPAGAQIENRYVDGVLTDQPLWPWPMNDRIKQAMIQSGYDQKGGLDGHGGTDLTKTIFEFGGGTLPFFYK